MSVEEIMKLMKMALFYIYWHRSYGVLFEVTDNRFEIHWVDMFHQVHRTVESVFHLYTSVCFLPL